MRRNCLHASFFVNIGINSPLRTHLETRPIAKPDTKDVSPLKDSRKARLATLAHSINDWEDESNISSKSASSTPVKAKKDPTTPAKYGSSAAASPARRDIYSAKKPEPAMIAASESQVDGNCTSSARKDTQRASPVVVLDKSVLRCLVWLRALAQCVVVAV